MNTLTQHQSDKDTVFKQNMITKLYNTIKEAYQLQAIISSINDLL